MNKIPIANSASLKLIKTWFSGIDAAKPIENLNAIIIDKKFPGVVSFICENGSRYFLVDPEVAHKVAISCFQNFPITPTERVFLDSIKSQLDNRVQMRVDVDGDVTIEKCESIPEIIRSFEVLCPKVGGLRRFIVEILPVVKPLNDV